MTTIHSKQTHITVKREHVTTQQGALQENQVIAIEHPTSSDGNLTPLIELLYAMHTENQKQKSDYKEAM